MSAVAALRDRFGVDPVLRVLGVAPSTYYDWLAQEGNPSSRRRADQELLAQIAAVHARSGATYGSPRVHATLQRRGLHMCRENGSSG